MSRALLVGTFGAFAASALALGIVLVDGSHPPENPVARAASEMRARFGARAREVLDGEQAIAASPDGFQAPVGEAAFILPRSGADPLRLRTPAGEVRVRELGASGPASREGSTVAYARAGGASFWSVAARGLEEWIYVDSARGDAPVAVWELEGGGLRPRGAAVEILDARGRLALTVAAPAAWSPSRSIDARLEVRGGRIELWADAGGEPALIDPSWSGVAAMHTSRGFHTLTLLPNGQALAVGGYTGGYVTLNTAELFSPVTTVWAQTGMLNAYHAEHAAVLLQDGRVMIAGGDDENLLTSNVVEAYDPATGGWTLLASMNAARADFTLTMVAGGKVVAAGGTSCPTSLPLGNCAVTLNTVEIYDPVANTWTMVPGTMSSARAFHAATLDPAGDVVVMGGDLVTPNGTMVNYQPLNNVDVYEVSKNALSGARGMLQQRSGHTATLLPTGQILVVGGGTGLSPTAEVYDAATNLWTPLSGAPIEARNSHTATLIPDAAIVVAGGADNNGISLKSSELYGLSPSTPPYTTGTLLNGRANAAAVTLNDGRVVIAGGLDDAGAFFGAAETFNIFGAACAPDAGQPCAYGTCTGSVCCNTACSGTCQTCLHADGATADGLCGVAKAGTPCPGGACMNGTCVAPSSSSSASSTSSASSSGGGSSAQSSSSSTSAASTASSTSAASGSTSSSASTSGTGGVAAASGSSSHGSTGAGGGGSAPPPTDFGCALAPPRPRRTPEIGALLALALLAPRLRGGRRARRAPRTT